MSWIAFPLSTEQKENLDGWIGTLSDPILKEQMELATVGWDTENFTEEQFDEAILLVTENNEAVDLYNCLDDIGSGHRPPAE